MNYNKAELCKDCKKPVGKQGLNRDRRLYTMLDDLESLINATGFTNERDRRKLKNAVLKIMDYIF